MLSVENIQRVSGQSDLPPRFRRVKRAARESLQQVQERRPPFDKEQFHYTKPQNLEWQPGQGASKPTELEMESSRRAAWSTAVRSANRTRDIILFRSNGRQSSAAWKTRFIQTKSASEKTTRLEQDMTRSQHYLESPYSSILKVVSSQKEGKR